MKTGFWERVFIDSIEICLDPFNVNRDSGIQLTLGLKPLLHLIDHFEALIGKVINLQLFAQG